MLSILDTQYPTRCPFQMRAAPQAGAPPIHTCEPTLSPPSPRDTAPARWPHRPRRLSVSPARSISLPLELVRHTEPRTVTWGSVRCAAREPRARVTDTCQARGPGGGGQQEKHEDTAWWAVWQGMGTGGTNCEPGAVWRLLWTPVGLGGLRHPEGCRWTDVDMDTQAGFITSRLIEAMAICPKSSEPKKG